MRIYLQTPVTDDRPPRFCHLFLQKDLLEGWTVVRETGYQGERGRVTRRHYDSHEQAERALLAARDDQIRRGFRVMFAEGQESPR